MTNLIWFVSSMAMLNSCLVRSEENSFYHDLINLNRGKTNNATDGLELQSRLIEANNFCTMRTDGLYDDPENCEKFIICYMEQTFYTKCAEGTQWNHFSKECDYPELGNWFVLNFDSKWVVFIEMFDCDSWLWEENNHDHVEDVADISHHQNN